MDKQMAIRMFGLKQCMNRQKNEKIKQNMNLFKKKS